VSDVVRERLGMITGAELAAPHEPPVSRVPEQLRATGWREIAAHVWIRDSEADAPPGVDGGAAASRLLVLTGCRRNEILGLRWEDLDFEAGEMRLVDSKTGARVAPMPPPAAQVLARLSRVEGNPWVFPGRKKGTGQRNINDSWDRVRRRAGLDGVRLHDLRHSYASRALALGEGLPMIGELLGHRTVQTTARYAHLARDSVRASTSRVAESIGADILPD
jgi:integrase